MKKIVDSLKKLGLSDYEALIYGTLLVASPSSATTIAKKCNLSRSSVYTTLNTLVGKGLVGTTYKNTVKQFVAEDHTALEGMIQKEKELLHEKEEVLELLQDDIQSVTQNNLNVPHVIFFEGQEGLKKIYLSMMRHASQGETLCLLRDEFVWRKEWQFIFGEDWHRRVKKIKSEKNIQTKLLVNNSKEEAKHAPYYKTKNGLQSRKLSKQFLVSDFALYIIGDTVSMLSTEQQNLLGIKIVNQHMSNNLKMLFEALWHSAEDI